MPYLIIRYQIYGAAAAEVVEFESPAAAESALCAVRDSAGGAVTIVSDRGETLVMRRDHIVSVELSDEPPPQSDGHPPADIDVLKAKLGTPIYEGPNLFSDGVLGEPLSAAVLEFALPTDNHAAVWRCRPETDDLICMALRKSGGPWRYWPCALHRDDLGRHP